MSANSANPAHDLPPICRPAAALKLILPREHGSWSLALEPLALGLLVAFSWAGLPLAVAAMAVFFLRRPTRLLLQATPNPRRPLAAFCVGALLLITVAALWAAVQWGGLANLWPLIPAALAGSVFVWFDSRGENREGPAELAGTTAFALLPAAFAALAGWRMENCLALASFMLARSVPTVLAVRAFLRRRKGRDVSFAPARLAAIAATGVLIWLALLSLVPWAVVVFSAVLAARAFWFATAQAAQLSARRLGLGELFLGVAAVVVAAAAW